MTSPAIPSSRLRLVPDAGFYVVAALNDGYARSYLIGRGPKFLTYELFASEVILHNIQEKLEDIFGLDRARVVAIIQQLRKMVTIVHPTRRITLLKDAQDNKVLESAHEAKADFVVSLEYDLLQLGEFESSKITHPSLLPRLLPVLARSFPRQKQLSNKSAK